MKQIYPASITGKGARFAAGGSVLDHAFGTGKLDLIKGQFVAKMEATILIGLPLVLIARRFLLPRHGHIVSETAA